MKKKHLILIIIGMIIWFIETAYFGWNWKAQSDPERFWDFISGLFIFWGIIGDILSGLTITKTTNIENQTDNMQSDKLFLQIRKGSHLHFPGGVDAETKKDISAPLTKGFEKKAAKK